MQFKAGVVLWNMDPIIEQAMDRIDEVHRDVVGRDAIVTSARDGEHAANSLHFEGRALDFRTRDLSPELKRRLTTALQTELGDAYDVVLETSHIHVELDP